MQATVHRDGRVTERALVSSLSLPPGRGRTRPSEPGRGSPEHEADASEENEMWKRDDDEKDEEGKGSVETATTGREREQTSVGSRPGSGQAVIGSSIRIRGEVSGDEDLVIQGRVDGSVDLDQNTVTVGPDGEVTADITGRTITVEGRVEGDLTAEEQIVLRSSARVEGDIRAPRVVLEDGAHFRGGVQMGDAAGGTGGKATAGSSATKKAGASGGGSGSSSRSAGGTKKEEKDAAEDGGSGSSDGDD